MLRLLEAIQEIESHLVAAPLPFFKRLSLVLFLLTLEFFAAIAAFFRLVFLSSNQSFATLYAIKPDRGYVASYTKHQQVQRGARIGSVVMLSLGIGVSVLFGVLGGGPIVHAVDDACPITDGGAGDDDAANDGTLTVSSDTTWTPVSANAFGCTGKTLHVTNNATLTIAGDIVNGYVGAVNIDSVTIDAGSKISADGRGCIAAGSANGYGPDASNICVLNGPGRGRGVNNNGGAAGGGNGGSGGKGTSFEASTFISADAKAPLKFGASGGDAAAQGGTGGGVIRLNLTGTLTNNGEITADGTDGAVASTARGAGGGAGGSIWVSAPTIAGAGTFTATGGAGGDNTSNDGGGGGGGRIAVTYNTDNMGFGASTFSTTGGVGPDNADDGTKGTVYTEDVDGNIVKIFDGFTYDDTDYNETDWIVDSGATSQYCDVGAANPSITATNLTMGGALKCSTGAMTSFNLIAGGSFTLLPNTVFSVKDQGANVDFTIPVADHQTGAKAWNSVTIGAGAEGDFTISDAVNIGLSGTSLIRGNTLWTGVGNVTIGLNASINANGRGCLAVSNTANGNGPDGTNTCVLNGSGRGEGANATNNAASGGANGGTGGNSENDYKKGGLTYGSSMAPDKYGASGGSMGTGAYGGVGGGYVRIASTGTVTNNGLISANGGIGGNDNGYNNRAGGGGGGGSVYLSSDTIAGTGTFQAIGGDGLVGGTKESGSGGGGRIALTYNTDNMTLVSGDFDVSAGAKVGSGGQGNKGTVYTKDLDSNVVAIFDGFTYDNTDHNVTTWNVDSNATNQYCAVGTATPSVTAANLTLGGSINCDEPTLTSFNLAASGDLTVRDDFLFSINNNEATSDWTIPLGDHQTWTNLVATLGNEGNWTINDAVDITLAGTSAISGNVSWTGLTNFTLGASAAIQADGKGCAAEGFANGFGDNGTDCVLDGPGRGVGANTSGQGGGGGAYGGIGGNSEGNTKLGGTTFEQALAPAKFGASGGSISTAAAGGTGGGKIRIDTTGIATVDGKITSDGLIGLNDNNNNNRAGGGGSGGTIYLTADTLTGAGKFSVEGGPGIQGGTKESGGGGGGRIALTYNTDNMTIVADDFSAVGGVAPGNGFNGGAGTVYTKDLDSSIVKVFSGFTFDDTDHNVTSWIMDSGATNQYCEATAATPSITAANLTLGGSIKCDTASMQTFNFSAGTDLTVLDSFVLSADNPKTDVDLTIPAGDNQTWNNVTVTVGAEGDFTINDAADIVLTGSSAINANAQWTNLTSLNIAGTASINANGRGCRATDAGNGSGPDGFNDCVVGGTGSGQGVGSTSQGAGGGAHGGDAGKGETNAGGTQYDDAITPNKYGASGGSATVAAAGGAGGGYLRLGTSGTLTLAGTITADGMLGLNDNNNNNRAGGGGAGGSIHVTSDTVTGLGTFSAIGGPGRTGGSRESGGGGGGRISFSYNTDNMTVAANDFAISGGAATGSGVAGDTGTVYVRDIDGDDVKIFHGFTFDDTDHSASSWTTDSSAINQYCDSTAATPSITTTGALLLSGTLACKGGSMASFNFSAGTSFDIADNSTITIEDKGVDIDIHAPDNQTWTNVALTGAPEGELTINNPIDIVLAGTTTVNANAVWTGLNNLQIDSGATLSANTRGCVATGGDHGSASNDARSCILNGPGSGQGQNSTARGAGGGAYGGAAGNGDQLAGGAAHGSDLLPVRFGSSGGNASPNALGGSGGGYIRLNLTDTLTLNGSITANGGVGDNAGGTNGRAAGGGSGGAIHLSVATLSGSTGNVLSNGGNGADNGNYEGGGGSGGRVRLEFVTDNLDTSGWTAGAKVAGGLGPDTAQDGQPGSFSRLLYTVPNKTSVTNLNNNSFNHARTPSIVSANFVDNGGGHIDTERKVTTDSGGNTTVWTSTQSANLTSEAVNAANGTFSGALDGQTQLAANTEYYLWVRYRNRAGNGAWSDAVKIRTINDANASTVNAPFEDATPSTAWGYDDTKIDVNNASSGLAELDDLGGGTYTAMGIGGRLKRVPVTVDNQGSGSTLTNHQVRVPITYDPDMQADFDDIIFTASDGTTIIDHWTESFVASTSAIAWVEVPTIAASADTTIYYYYGSAGATSSSNAGNTFLFGDGFDGPSLHADWTELTLGGSVEGTFVDGRWRKTCNGECDWWSSSALDSGAYVEDPAPTSTWEAITLLNTATNSANQHNGIMLYQGASDGYMWGRSSANYGTSQTGSSKCSVGDATAPQYLKIQKTTGNGLGVNDTYSFWRSADAVTWAQCGTYTTSDVMDNVGLFNKDWQAGETVSEFDFFFVKNYTSLEPLISTGPEQVSGNFDDVKVVNKNGINYDVLFSFSHTLGASNAGKVAYQLGYDGDRDGTIDSDPDAAADGWYFHNGTSWTKKSVDSADNNTQTEVNSYFPAFATEVGTGHLYYKAFLISDGSQKVELDAVNVKYNANPTVSTIGTQTLTEDVHVNAKFNLNNFFADPNDTLSYSVIDGFNPSLGTMTVNGDGTVDFTLAPNANGSDTIRLRGTDLSGSVVNSNTLTVAVNPVNDAPVANAGDDAAADEEDISGLLSGANSADVDGDSITYSWSKVADTTNSCTITNATTETPTVAYKNRASNYSCTFRLAVSDGVLTSVQDDVVVNVTADDDPPIADAGANATVDEDDAAGANALALQLRQGFSDAAAGSVTLDGGSSTDPEGQTLTPEWIEIIDSGDGCSLDSSQLSSFAPSVTILNRESNYSCEYGLTVSDGTNESARDRVTLNINADNDAPVITQVADKSANEKETLTFSVQASDLDTAALTLSAEDENGDFVAQDISVDDLFSQSGNVGTFSWTPSAQAAGNYQLTIAAADGANTVTDIINIAVADTAVAPTLTKSIPNVSFEAGTTTQDIFDLQDYFTDANGDDLTYAVSGNTNLVIDISNGKVTLSADEDYEGNEEITFSATDPDGGYAESNAVVVTVASSEVEADEVGHVKGNAKGKGVIKIVDKEGEVVASWKAFPKGGAIPKLGKIKNETYVFVVKNTSGTTMHVYTLNGKIVKKTKISPNLHLRQLAVGELDGKKYTREIAVATLRGRTVYIKLFSFNVNKKKFSVLRRNRYRAKKTSKLARTIRNQNYSISIQNGYVRLKSKKNGGIFYKWKPKFKK